MNFIERMTPDRPINPKTHKTLILVGNIIAVTVVIAVILAWLSVPVWCLTHTVHHSHFTWWIVYFVWVLSAIVTGLIIEAQD